MVGNLSHGFGKFRFLDSKMDCTFCSLQSSEEENYKNMKKFILVIKLFGLEAYYIPLANLDSEVDSFKDA